MRPTASSCVGAERFVKNEMKNRIGYRVKKTPAADDRGVFLGRAENARISVDFDHVGMQCDLTPARAKGDLLRDDMSTH